MRSNSLRRFRRHLLLILALLLLSGTGAAQQLIPLADGSFAVLLSNGQVSFLGGPPPLNLQAGPVNLPGNHIGRPLALSIDPVARAFGYIAVPTTGGNITILDSFGLVVGTFNLPGDHVGQMIEFGVVGHIAVPTSGGNLTIISDMGANLGTINLPGEHMAGPPLAFGGGGNLLVLNQNNQLFIINALAGGGPAQVGGALNLPGSPASAILAGGGALVVNQNNQIFNVVLGPGGPVQIGQPLNLPGAPAGPPVAIGGGNFFIVNGNNQVFAFNMAGGPGGGPVQNGQALNLGGAPAFQAQVGGGSWILVNQNNQVVLINPGAVGRPAQVGQVLNLPGAPAFPPMQIPAGVPNAGFLVMINKNGQVQIINPVGGPGGGPAPAGPPLNLPNSPLYAVPNGLPGVYVVCCTGGTVFIVDCSGPGGAANVQGYNFPGEHTGPPTMSTDAAGNHIVEIETTSGVYEINKGPAAGPPAPGPPRPIPEQNLGGHLACVAPAAMASAATPGATLLASVDTSGMGDQTSNLGATVAVFDTAEEGIIHEELIPEQPYEMAYTIPEHVPPGSAYTLLSTLVDDDGDGPQTVGAGAVTVPVISPMTVEVLLDATVQAMSGETIAMIFDLENIGVHPDHYVLKAFDSEGWPIELTVPEIALEPGEVASVEVLVIIPEDAFEGQSSEISLWAESMTLPGWSSSDWGVVAIGLVDADVDTVPDDDVEPEP